jgi:hypothetical protein
MDEGEVGDGSSDNGSGRRRTAAAVLLAAGLAGLATPASAQIYTRVRNGVVEATNAPSSREFRLTYPGKGRVIHSRGFRIRASNNAVYNHHIEAAATLHRVDIALVRAVMQVESQFDHLAVSTAGAQGLMQLMPDTARRFGVSDSFDPRQNIFGGVAYLRFLLDLFGGDVDRVLAGYNAGENAVLKYNGIPPYKETQNYVRKIRGLLDGGGGSDFSPGQAAFLTPSGNFGRPAASASLTVVPLSTSVKTAAVMARAGGRPRPLKPRTYYKWMGGDGVLHISQDPPGDGVTFSTIRALD